MRTYKSGTNWCVWRWTTTDSEYITRLHVVKTPWFAICLHWINKPDPEPYLHDHPVSFFSIVLRGGYSEIRNKLGYTSLAGIQNGTLNFISHHNWFNIVKATFNDRHTICDVKPNTVTLVFMGPKTRDWGFHTNAGWVYWKDYYKEQRNSKVTK